MPFLSVTIYWTVIVHENIMNQYANGSTENVIYWYANIILYKHYINRMKLPGKYYAY